MESVLGSNTAAWRGHGAGGSANHPRRTADAGCTAAGLTIGPRIPGIAQINPRETVEGGSNNVTWYEVVGLKEGSATIEAKHPTGTIWDFFELRVNKAFGFIRPPIRGINYDYSVDTKGIGPNTNASLVLTLKMAMIPVPGGKAIQNSGQTFTSQKWDQTEWNSWISAFKDVVQSHWSEKFWLATPASLSELEVASGGRKSRVQLHCVLKLEFQSIIGAHHRVDVLKTGTVGGVQFRSDSTSYEVTDIATEPPSATGFPKPFTTVVHEIGHTLGLHHPCERSWPTQPYCLAGHPNEKEIMGKGDELRIRYATPWQNAAASWFNSNMPGRSLKPADFRPSVHRIAPVSV